MDGKSRALALASFLLAAAALWWALRWIDIGLAACLALALILTLLRRRLPPAWRAAFTSRGALVTSLGLLMSQGLAVWSALRTCHLRIGLPAGIAVMLAVRLGTLLPGAPANLGTHQASALFGLSLFGVAGSQAVSIAFILFAVLTIPLWLLGMLALASAGLSVRSAVRLSAAP